MRPLRVMLMLSLSVVPIADALATDSFTVGQWDLASAVNGGFPDTDGHSFDTVENPFNDSHAVAVGDSTAAASYDFAWAAEFGRFLIEGTHQAEDVGFSSTTGGWLLFYATEPVTYDIDIAYTYDLPGGALRGGFTYNLLDTDTLDSFSVGSYHDDTWTAGPVSGTLAIQASGMLPAGHPYAFTYKMELDSYGNSGYLATGSGHVDLTLTAVPEPTSLGPLAILALIARRRRSGWRYAVR